MKIALGTVQFGLPYGITNRSGQVQHAEVKAILDLASASGIDMLDTAIAYGESEHCLGQIGIDGWRIVTKLPAVPDAIHDVADWVEAQVAGSLSRLKADRLYGLLLHCPDQLIGPNGDALYRALASLKKRDKVEKIGISVYDPEQLDLLWPKFRFDLVQAPFNIIDRRLAASGWLARLHDDGAEVHIRSIFLQGLLLAQKTKWPAYFDRWKSLRGQWFNWLKENTLSSLQGCLGLALSKPEIDLIVVGVESAKQLQEILAATRAAPVVPPETLASEDLDLINPARWNTA